MKNVIKALTRPGALLGFSIAAILFVAGVAEAQNANVALNGAKSLPSANITDKQKDDVQNLLNYYSKKIYFTENKGQWPGNVLYKADFHLGQAIATKDGMLVGTFDPADVAARDEWSIREEESIRRGARITEPGGSAKGHGWLMNFVNHSADMAIETQEKHVDQFNYFAANGTSQTGVNNYQEIWYRNVYNNVDVRYYPSEAGTLEYDIVCKPGFNKNEIAIQLKGIDKVTVANDGHLVFKTSAGDMDFPAPVAYQKGDDKKHLPVKVSYYITNDNVLHFTLGAYDETKTLIIDPIALRWATWITNNSADADHGHCIWVDPKDGGIYVVTRFGGAGLITTSAFQNSYAGGSGDDFVIGKYYEPTSEGGSGTRVWQTYLGGTGEDNPYAITQGLDSAIYITGYTSSSNFPMIGGTKFGTTANGINESSQITSGHTGIVVTKIWKDGQSIKSAVVAGNGENYSFDIGMDSKGDLSICGFTSSTNLHALFPSTNATNTDAGGADVLVFQLTSDFTTMNWMRNYGGSGRDVATILQQNPVTNEIYLAGYTASTNFPISSNARQTTLTGKTADGFLQKLNSTGGTIWSTYFNSASGDSTVILCMEFNTTYDKLYFGGLTTGLGTNNTPSGTYQAKIGGGQDFFCAIVDTNQTFVASTYIGGSGNEVNMMGLNVDLNNDVYVFGYTPSTNFPVTSDAVQSTNMGSDDKVFFKLHSDLTSLVFSTYYGGSSDDYDPVGERGIKFSNCRIYTIVTAESNNIPLTQGALTTSKLSSASVYEPGIVEWANPPDLLNNTITTSQIICPGNTPIDLIGSVPSYSLPTISRNGVTSAYPTTLPTATTYQWQTSADSVNWTAITGGTTQNLSGSLVGAVYSKTFIRRIINGDACIVAGAADQLITIKTITLSATAQSNDICATDKNGSITVTVSNGTAPYTYHWSNGATTQSLSNLTPGTYTITATDQGGCSTSGTYVITGGTAITHAVTVTPTTCGNNNGAAKLTVSGGVSPYNILWSNSATGTDLTGLAANTYTVQITDANSCTSDTSVSILASVPPTVLVNGASICNETSTALTASGASTYTWLPNSNLSATSGISVNANPSATITYTVTGTDLIGCTATATSVVTVNALPTSAISGANTICSYSTANLQSNANAGSGSISAYQWQLNGSTINGATAASYTTNGSGNYSVVVTNSNNCTAASAASFSLTKAAVIAIQATSVNNAACNGNQDGSINLTVSGGVPGYSYSWSNGASAQNISGLGAGNYSVIVTDGIGCTATNTGSYTIGQPATLAINANGVVVANANCNGDQNGSIVLSINGGTPAYTYSWSNGASTQNISGLGAGDYSVTITDAHACSVSQSYTIGQPATLAIDANGVVVANANCNGDQNGSIVLSINGGTPAYTYSWSNGASTQDISGLGAGVYSVTITDAHNCSVSQSYTIGQPATLAIDANGVVVANANCNGDQNGSISISVNGGTPSYTYSWSNGASTQNISGLGAGDYSVTITDAHACSISKSYTITQPTVLSIDGDAVITGASCNGQKNGSISINVEGGSPSYTYSWDNGATTQNISSLTAGNFSVTVTDSHGCSTSQSYTVSQPSTLSINANGVVTADANCNGDQNGSIDLSISGGLTPYTYSWSNGATAQDISSLGAGNYSVTIADAHNCSVSNSYTIGQPTTLAIDANGVVVANANCNGDQNGSITITVNGGTPAYTYSWSNGASTQNISGLGAGDYSVTITDAHACSVSQSYTIGQPSTLVVDANGVVFANANCNGDQNGSISISVNGGTSAYTYSWSNGASTQNISGLGAGDYSVTITDAHACSVSQSYTIGQPATLAIDANGVVVANANCNGDQNGSITISVNGGTPAYTYSWSNGASTQNISGLGAGDYSVTITDAHACSVSQSYTIGQPATLAIDANGVVVANANCNGDQNGSITISVNGGTPAYTYSWSNGASTQNISGLGAGDYSVTITDAHNCSVSQLYTIGQPATLAIDASGVVVANANCNGDQNGSITITVNGGTPAYTYSWSNGSSTQNISGLGAGDYSVTITDAHACSVSQSYTIGQPATLAIDANGVVVADANCNGDQNGSISITVNGGTPSYTYSWSNGASTQDISGLGTGDYSVTITDAHGCSVSQFYTIGQPATLAIDANGVVVANANCNGDQNGSITITVNGGTPAYTYSWSNGASTQNISGLGAGDYSVTITDAHACSVSQSYTIGQPATLAIDANGVVVANANCNGDQNGSIIITVNGGTPSYTYSWSNGASTQNISALGAGDYSVTITDAHGCSTSGSYHIDQPALLSASGSITDAACNSTPNGAVDITVEGGTASYTYSWSNGASTQNLSQLTANDYTVTITDAHGCSTVNTYTVKQPSTLAVSGTTTDANCNGDQNGAIVVAVSGGSPEYVYSWSNGVNSKDISNIAAGDYGITVSDSHGCAVSESFTINQPTKLVIDSNAVVLANANCNGNQNGAVNITIDGGSPAYSYKWSNGATSQNISGLDANNYTVDVTDGHGCAASQSYTISQPTVLVIDSTPAVITNANCNGDQNGAISITINGGSPAYSYSWSNGATTQNVSGLNADGYSVSVTDAHGCSISQSYTVSQPTVLAIDTNAVVVANANCNADQNGSISISVKGGSPDYSYNWSTGAATQNISNLGANTYSVSVTDAHGCSASQSYTISQPTVLVIDSAAAVLSNAKCNGDQNGAISITINGGSPAYSFNWSNGAATQNISGLSASNYSVSVTDAHGCTTSQSYTISQPKTLAIDTPENALSDAKCNGDQNGAIFIAAAGGTPSYSFSWSNGATSQQLSGLSAGGYTVSVTDANGCSASQSFTISQPAALALDSTAAIIANANCNGDQNGAIAISVNGGTPSYSFIWSNGASTQNISTLSANSYSVSITDAHGCVVSQSYTISQPTMLAIDSNAVVVANANCYGNQNGAINITVNGGSPSYSYNWSNGASTQNISSLGANSYSVSVTDTHGCSASQAYTISQPTVLSLDSTVAVIANANCNGNQNGSISITVNGGTPSYSYNWSNGASTQNVSGLGADSYSVSVTDAQGCSAAQSYTINQPTALAIDTNAVVVDNSSCHAEQNGSISIIVNGGTPSYSYNWSNGASTQNVSGLGASTYSVSVSDAHGCSVSQSYTINQPTVLVIDTNAASITNANCNGDQNGSISIAVNGGTPSYSYAWSNGSTSENISGLAAANYSVTVTDTHSCSISASFNVSQPIVLALDGTATDVKCNGEANGSVATTVTGGSGTYTYSWSNGASSDDISSLVANSYSLTVTDAHSCSISQSYTIGQPATIVINGNTTDANCTGEQDGAISITVTGGSVAYTYNWSNGAETEDLSNVAAGNYTVIVKDANACTASDDFTINFIKVTSNGGPDENIDCSTNSVQLDAQGIGTWSVVSGQGSLSSDSDAHATLSNVPKNVSVVLVWTVTNGTCSASDTVNVGACKDTAVFIPTGFSPNGDGKNDFFVIKGIGKYPNNSLTVFNRWGSGVYQKENYNNEWGGDSMDGQPLPDGTYFVVFTSQDDGGIKYASFVDLRRK